MSKQKLIFRLKEKNPQLTYSDSEDIIDIFLKDISKSLKRGSTIEIRGFGKWFSKRLKENFNARNPSTNELIYKPERVKVRFRASKNLNKKINE